VQGLSVYSLVWACSLLFQGAQVVFMAAVMHAVCQGRTGLLHFTEKEKPKVL
jgi:hypothetical protein